MLRIIFAVAAILSISSCDSDPDRTARALENKISTTISSNWRTGIPLDDLVEAMQTCQQNPALKGCTTVENQIQDIATSLATCQADQRSRLCQSVIGAIANNPTTTVLPKANGLQLPDAPWYWSLPTAMLNAQATNFNYRQEVASWWWQAWGKYLISCIALLVSAFLAWVWWSDHEEKRKALAAEMIRQRAACAEQERVSRIRQEQAQAEVARQEKLAHEAAIAEQQRQVAENLAQQAAADAAAKLTAEQAEAANILSTAFKSTSKPKRGKYAPPP